MSVEQLCFVDVRHPCGREFVDVGRQADNRSCGEMHLDVEIGRNLAALAFLQSGRYATRDLVGVDPESDCFSQEGVVQCLDV